MKKRMRGFQDDQGCIGGWNEEQYLLEIYRMIFISRLQEATFNRTSDDPLDQRYS